MSDSLELLLDTICNIFGGIILMAILIVIQTRVTSGRLPKPESQDNERVLEARKLRFEYDRLQRKIEDVRKQKEDLTNRYQSTASPVTTQLLEARRNFSEALKKATEKEKQMREEVNQSRQVLLNNEMSLREITAEWDAMKKEHETLERQLKTASQGPSKQLRLPHRRYVGGSNWCYYVVKGKHAYLLETVSYSSSSHRSGQCMVEPIDHIARPAARITPIENNGYFVRMKRQSTAFLNSLKKYSPSRYSVSFFVFGDSESFASFQELKHTVLDNGYLYSVTAYSPEEGLVVHPVAALPVE